MLCLVGGRRAGGSGRRQADGVWGRLRTQPLRARLHARRSLGAAEAGGLRRDAAAASGSAAL
eukprot:3847817-Pleurochrysis_carterae.AAC.1